MELQQKKSVSYSSAVLDWVDNVFLPMIRVIWEQGMLRDFSGRTPTDLFLWLVNHQDELATTIGWRVDPEKAAEDLVSKYSTHPLRVLIRLKDRIARAFLPKILDAGPAPGDWRKQRSFPRRDDRLFSASLVAVTGENQGWKALEQALLVAKHEQAGVRGIHVIPEGSGLSVERFQEIRNGFDVRCKKFNIPGEFVVEQGEVAARITDRARWHDLIVIGLVHPPEDQPIARLRSGLRKIIQSSSRPLLIVPSVSPMEKALVAYDGSQKANEALFLATYLANNWGIKLVVLTAVQAGVSRPEPLDRARSYLEARRVDADYIRKVGTPGDAIIQASGECQCDFLIMGGYGYKPVLEMVLGSTVDQVLRSYRAPILICR
jgi:nucleotide-binding universal stress UspA family protein